MYLDFPTVAAGRDEVMDDSRVWHLDRQRQGVDPTLRAAHQERPDRQGRQNLHGNLSARIKSKMIIVESFSNPRPSFAYRDNPGWYHGAAFNSSSSSIITGGTLPKDIGVGDGTGGGGLTMDFSEFERRSAKCLDLFSPTATAVLLLFLMLFRTALPLRSLMRHVMLPAVSFLMMLRLFRLTSAWNERVRRGALDQEAIYSELIRGHFFRNRMPLGDR